MISKWELAKINSFAFGLEIVSAAAMTFIVPSLLSSELPEEVVGFFLAMGPFSAMIFAPRIGAMSDDYDRPGYGKRTPFILYISAMILLGLLLIPYSTLLSKCFPDQYSGLIHLIFLFIGIVIMDGGVNAAFTPFEALLDDMYHEQAGGSQRAFGMKSFMVSFGGSFAYLLCSLDLNSFALSEILGGADRLLFLILFFGFSLAIYISLGEVHRSNHSPNEGVQNWCHISPIYLPQYIFKLPSFFFKIPALIRAIISSFFELISLLFMMPSVFTRLWVAHFCSWMGLMCVILYYTEFFGEIMYQGDPNAEKGSIDRQNYEEGLRMGSLGLFTQNIIAMFSSFYIDALILKFGKRNVFLLSTGLFAISTGIIFVSRNVVLVILATGTTGLLLTTIQVLPYSLISQYQKDATAYQDDDGSSDWSRGLCEVYALLDSAYYLSQLVSISFVQTLLQFTKSPVSYTASSAIFGCLGIIAATQVVYDRNDFLNLLSGVVKVKRSRVGI